MPLEVITIIFFLLENSEESWFLPCSCNNSTLQDKPQISFTFLYFPFPSQALCPPRPALFYISSEILLPPLYFLHIGSGFGTAGGVCLLILRSSASNTLSAPYCFLWGWSDRWWFPRSVLGDEILTATAQSISNIHVSHVICFSLWYFASWNIGKWRERMVIFEHPLFPGGWTQADTFDFHDGSCSRLSIIQSRT